MSAKSFDNRLADTCLEVPLGTHVTTNVLLKVVLQFFEVEYVLALYARNDAGLFHQHQRVAELTALEVLHPLELDVYDPRSQSLLNVKGKCDGRRRDLFLFDADLRIRVAL